jgi:hypothetical protein
MFGGRTITTLLTAVAAVFAALAVALVSPTAVSPVALADDTEDEFTADLARWNEVGGSIPGTPSDWLKAANTVCEGTAELRAGGVSALDSIDAQVRAAVAGGWIKRDGGYFVIHAIRSFCPELGPGG